MERFEGDFLKEKYWGTRAFREAVNRAARRTVERKRKRVRNTPPELIENYLDRFSEITDREDPAKRERGIAAIERLVERKYIIKAENITDEYIKDVLLGNEAELLGYEREDIKDEQIRKTVLTSLEKKIRSPLDKYAVPPELRESIKNSIGHSPRCLGREITIPSAENTTSALTRRLLISRNLTRAGIGSCF